MIRFTHKGDFRQTEKFLRNAKNRSYRDVLEQLGQKGVNALANATPVDSGKTASSWSYSIEESSGSIAIVWSNSNVNKGLNIAVLLQYGHGTRNGGYVQGRDYINPAMQPIFDEIANRAWKEVVSK
jgi:hypothetical protein